MLDSMLPDNRVLLTVVLLFAHALPSSAAIIDDISGAISASSYTGYLTNLLYTHTGDNRGLSGAQHDLARENIFGAFQSFGLTTTLEAFTYSGSTYYNVVGVLPGAQRPGEYNIVGAHYDSVNNPGADDNASGVAGVIETARVLSQYSFEESLVFVAFDREEQGLIGSTAYAAAHPFGSLGMVSMDMIAYNPAGASNNQARLYTRDGLQNSATTGLASALNLYGGLTPVFSGAIGSSDHAPFARRGVPSALLIEAAWRNNPQYHRAGDSVDTAGYLDYAYATSMTRGTAAYLALEAEAIGAAIPEPAAVVLFASGLAALLLARRCADPSHERRVRLVYCPSQLTRLFQSAKAPLGLSRQAHASRTV